MAAHAGGDGVAAAGKPLKISLSLTASYAPSWGVWEGLRELVQNWHDGLLASSSAEAATKGGAASGSPLEFSEVKASLDARFKATRVGQEVGWCEHVLASNKLVLVNRGVGLGRKVLLLGYSQKAQHQDVIGSFGEGLKVGAVALLREGLRLRMFTKEEVWTFQLSVDPAFGERVLTVEAAVRPQDLDLELEGLPASLASLSFSDTATVLEGLPRQEWEPLSKRFLFLRPPTEAVKTEVGRLLLDEEHAHNFYVRGVWITDDPDIAAGVDLYDIRLDRDRAAVLRKSDLQHQVSSMWIRAIHYQPSLKQRYYEMLASDTQSSDTAFAELYCDDEAADALAATFRAQHGDAIPLSIKDSNSEKAQRIRTALSSSTVVCSHAMLAVLRKGGVRCDLDALLQECDLQSRRFLPMGDLENEKAARLARACKLVELAEPVWAQGMLLRVDVFEASTPWLRDSMVSKAEAFDKTRRLEVDVRALDPVLVREFMPSAQCFCAAGESTSTGRGGCRCAETMLACAILNLLSGASSKERLIARLAGLDGIGSDEILRCPDLGQAREVELRKQVAALEETLRAERSAHAGQLKSLQKRVDEAEKELRQTEFKFMDAFDAEKRVREQLEPEIRRLRQDAGQVAEMRALAHAAEEKSTEATREVVFLRCRCAELEKKAADAAEASQRRVATAEKSEASLRRALARRRHLLQKMLREDITAPLISLTDSSELHAAVEEIRQAIKEEETEQKCCVCAEGPMNIVLLPCRHQQTCMTCATALRECPLCRATIDERMQVFT